MGIPAVILDAEIAKPRPVRRSVAGTEKVCAIAFGIPIALWGTIKRRLLRVFDML